MTKPKRLLPLLAIALAGCVTSPIGRTQFMLVSPEAAIVEAYQAYATTLRHWSAERKLLHDPVLSDRVAAITGRLVGQAVALFPHTRHWHWSVALINDPANANAWCMAGGKMAIFSGFVIQIQPTDAELAQLIGHEISHAVANHQAESMSIALAQGLGVLAVEAASDEYSDVRAADMLATVALRLPNSRATEAEADRIGIELAARAGYDPAAGVSLWRKMERLPGPRPPQFLSTHPSPGNRAQALAKWVPAMRQLMPASPPVTHPVQMLP